MSQPDSDRRVVIALLALLVLGLAGMVLYADGIWPKAAMGLSNLMLVVVALGHAGYLLGWRRALVFFGMAFCLSWVAESLSIATGLAGPYHYTAAMGPRLGQVPWVVPLGWSAMIYNSHLIANLMAEGRPFSRHRQGVWLVGLALLTALIMTAWDLTLDPYMVIKGHAWVWEQGGPYFGIPTANYLSWLETGFLIGLALRLVEPNLPWPRRAGTGALVLAMPVLGYGIVGLADMWVGEPLATRVLSPFAMGIPVLAALGRLRHREAA
jgi:putative membrane protein